MLRVLNIRQPFASLIVHGIKRYETRARPTTTRGTLLIHAASSLHWFGVDTWRKLALHRPDVAKLLKAQSLDDLPRGHIIGEVNVTAVHNADPDRFTEFERHLAQFTPDTFALELTNPLAWPQTFRPTGLPGIWLWSPRGKEVHA